MCVYPAALSAIAQYPALCGAVAPAVPAARYCKRSEKNAGYTEYQEKKRRVNDLLTIKRNTDQVFYGAPPFSSLSVPLSCAVIDVLKFFDG